MIGSGLPDVVIDEGNDLGIMFVDLSDLEVLPNPIDNGQRGGYYQPLFDPMVGTPIWATTVCAWLGHEIAESLEDVMNGSRNRASTITR